MPWPLNGLLARVQRLEDTLNEALSRVVHLETENRDLRSAETERAARHADQMQQLESLFRRMSTRWQRHEQIVGGDSPNSANSGDNMALIKRLNGRR